MGEMNWGLNNCCNHEQVAFLVTVGAFTFVILLLWRTVLLTPFKLITVFLHEASHALACKLTCGQVEGIQVHANEGRVTKTHGGAYWLILPAGYLGSSFWGMALVLTSADLISAQIAAGCLAVALLIVLFIAQNWTLRGLCIDPGNKDGGQDSSICHSFYRCDEQLVLNLCDAEKFAENLSLPLQWCCMGSHMGNYFIYISLWSHVLGTRHFVLK
ncbi:hypothetical protein Droror1_Dr00019039 [Drosera rotundifolia]